MKIVSVVGARPQFVKLKPIHDAFWASGMRHSVIHTGQHYDANMSGVFFDGLNLPIPEINLEIGSGGHGEMTGKMLTALDQYFSESRPDFVVVYGDTNSTMAAALAAAKLEIPIGHVEAGLRSFNRAMPEEINRVVTDHVSNMLFAPTTIAMSNLENEGLSKASYQTGDVMADLVLSIADSLLSDYQPPSQLNGERFYVATIHRASNTDSSVQLRKLLAALSTLEDKVILVAHPRLISAANSFGLTLQAGNVSISEPLPYIEMMKLILSSSGVITDSGGLQKEAFLLGVPCVTLRTETEWPETLQGQMNVLDPFGEALEENLNRQVQAGVSKPFGDGTAANYIVKLINEFANV